MMDYAFFALWFLIAHALAPTDATVLTIENERHTEQRMQWVRAQDGAWDMTINGRELGRFRRTDEGVVHETGVGAPAMHRVEDLAEASDLRSHTTRIRLRGQFAPAVLDAVRDGAVVVLRDPSRRLTPVGLRLSSSNGARR
jgi:hypothetical protein